MLKLKREKCLEMAEVIRAAARALAKHGYNNSDLNTVAIELLSGDEGDYGISPDDLLRATCKVFGCSEKSILGKSRHRSKVKARHLVWWLVRHGQNPMILSDIARQFKVHHTSVMHGLEAFERRVKDEASYANICREVVKLLGMEDIYDTSWWLKAETSRTRRKVQETESTTYSPTSRERETEPQHMV